MKNLIYSIFCILTTSIIWSQNQLYIAPRTDVKALPELSVFFDGNTEVSSTASLTLESDATNSASFIASGSVTGNIE